MPYGCAASVALRTASTRATQVSLLANGLPGLREVLQAWHHAPAFLNSNPDSCPEESNVSRQAAPSSGIVQY